jgi:tight adherence protein C
MTVTLSFLAAAGIIVFLSGLPGFRRLGIARRVEPYLSGLHGRPSNLLRRSDALGWPPALRRAVARAAEIWPSSHAALQQRLDAAGGGVDALGFRLQQTVWGLAATVSVWTLGSAAALARIAIDARVLGPLTALAFAGGFLARDWRLSRQVENRRAQLQLELPTAIDLMALAIMAGESVTAPFARVSVLLPSAVGTELSVVVGDIRAGAPTIDALEGLKQRVPVTGVTRLVDALITGIERGSPLADVLRAQAEDGRDARRRSLLEIAGRREVLMLVPVVFLVMPVIVVFALLPSLFALELLVP